LRNSIENIATIYDVTEDPKRLDFLINTDDVLVKTLHYVEFWRENNVTISNLIYIMDFLSVFFKTSDEEKLLEIQVYFQISF